MRRYAKGLKTKKTQGGGELPQGMSRMDKPKDAPSWTKDSVSKKRRPNRRKK